MGSLWSTFASDDVRNAFVMGGVVIALLSLKNTVELAKKKQSSDLVFAGRNDKDFAGGISALKRRREAGSIRELAFARNYGQPDAVSVSYILNYFEAVSVGVSQKIYDESILKENYCGTVVKIWAYASDYVLELRKVQDNHAIYKNLQRMAERWGSPAKPRWKVRLPLVRSER
ncbi:DUF4760 domain-containing protein [Stenotrophomonas sp. PD6]|uniref:DUF4760 domain-containing protein n=1 Tax=Stenotrophomonas sp. PD6 TaxID=3368612 RepID=UPI003BA0422B